MPVLRREPRSEGSDRPPAEPEPITDVERRDEYSDARELATTYAEHSDVDRGGWCRTHYWAD
jgi:hypothetical protein